MSKHQKRLSAPKHYPIRRKDGSYITSITGSRSKDSAIPAALFLRDVTGYAETKSEVKQILDQGKLLRNGEELRDPREGIGVLDVVELPDAEESYRVIKKGRNLAFVPVDSTEVLAKIVDKSTDGDEFVYRLHNGENYRTKDEFDTGNTLVFNDGVSEVKLEEGAEVLVIGGQHAGEVATLEEIHERGMRDSTGTVESEFEFETPLKNLVAVEGVELGE